MEIHWKDYAPQVTTRKRETIEWSMFYSYNEPDKENPRVLLIGDSICNAYHSAVRERLDGTINVTYWASSKCVTDADYFRELAYILSLTAYDAICFNNGLHSLTGSDDSEWNAAYRAAVRLMRTAQPRAVLSLTLSTPLQDADKTARAAALNQMVMRIAADHALPVIDLFTPMDMLDRQEFWSDCFHFRAPAVAMQADILASHIRAVVHRTGNACHAETETGPDGAIQ